MSAVAFETFNIIETIDLDFPLVCPCPCLVGFGGIFLRVDM
jgi:hypothetical protein